MPIAPTRLSPRRLARRQWAVLLCLLCSVGPLMAADWQPVAQLACADDALVIDARPYARNAGGGSALELRYRYRGQVLDAVDYERYYLNLDAYRLRDPIHSYHFGLHLDMRGLSVSGERGDTLYLPPALADAAQVRGLADCIAGNRTLLRTRLRNTVIVSRSLLGLMRHTASPRLDGIARLIYAESPFLGIYQHTHLLVVLRDGRVMAHTDQTANNPGYATQIGVVEHTGKERPTLHLRAHYRLGGMPQEARHLRLWPNHRSGRALQDDYRIELETESRP